MIHKTNMLIETEENPPMLSRETLAALAGERSDRRWGCRAGSPLPLRERPPVPSVAIPFFSCKASMVAINLHPPPPVPLSPGTDPRGAGRGPGPTLLPYIF